LVDLFEYEHSFSVLYILLALNFSLDFLQIIFMLISQFQVLCCADISYWKWEPGKIYLHHRTL